MMLIWSVFNEISRSFSGTLWLPYFFPSACHSSNTTGANCSISALPCYILNPCQNNGTCINDNTIVRGYICACLPGFNGAECQLDHRPCQPNTCLNDGILDIKMTLIK